MRSRAELAAQVRRVEWTETAGELGALLLEAREVREAQPVYNRQLRGGGERLTWLFDDGAAAPQLVDLDADVLRSGNAFGTYRAARDARHALESLAREHHWCFKLLGLEAAQGSCFGFQVGRCNGACAGKEPARVHLARVKLGLMPRRLEPWPHAGPVVVREGAGERGSSTSSTPGSTWHVRWRRQERTSAAPLAAQVGQAAHFDIETYRIITRVLRERRLLPLPSPSRLRVDDSWN